MEIGIAENVGTDASRLVVSVVEEKRLPDCFCLLSEVMRQDLL